MSDYDEQRMASYALQHIKNSKGVEWQRMSKTVDTSPEWPTEERINSIGQNVPTGEHYMNKYQRKLTNPTYVQRGGPDEIEEDVIIDVYDVLDAFGVENPATAHAIKKLLCTGSRGAKDWETDLQEAIDSLERAKSFPPVPF